MLVLIRLVVSIASLESTESIVSLESTRRLERIRRQRVSQKEHTFLLEVNRRTIEVSKLVGALGNGRQLAC